MARKAQRAGHGSRLGRWALRACGRQGAAARGARAEACEARAERSGRGRQARAWQVSGSRRGHAWSARGRAGWTAGVQPGRPARGMGTLRAAWPGLCTRCTQLDFQTGFSTRYFSQVSK